MTPGNYSEDEFEEEDNDAIENRNDMADKYVVSLGDDVGKSHSSLLNQLGGLRDTVAQQ